MPRPSLYRHIFIVEKVLDVFRNESRKVGWRETGGPLVGYTSDDHAVVVVGATGPGPRSRLQRMSVEIDGEYATSFCNSVYRESKGSFYYIGDWHRHIGWSVTPSNSDEEAIQQIAASGACSLTAPISIIYRKRPERLVVYVLMKRRLMPLSHSVISGIPSA